VLHIHVGPSPLALGLLVPATLIAGFDVCVVGRSGTASPREYVHVGSGRKGRLRYLKVGWFIGPQKAGDLPDELLARIRSEEPLLLTCTLRGAIAERRGFIEEALRERPVEAETLMLACENAPKPGYGQIAGGCESHVVTLRTVVNRMCVGLDPDSEGRRTVSAHPLGEWLIERGSSTPTLLGALEGVDDVIEIVDDIDGCHDRKLWMVNGAHQALALMAWKAKTVELDRVMKVPRVAARLHHLHAAMDTALGPRHPGLEDNLAYGMDHVEAYAEHLDGAERVLGAFVRRDLAPFIDTLDVRLAQPARICSELGCSVAPFEFVFDLFESLVENLDAFLDAVEIRSNPESFELAADQRAVAAYSRLVHGWNPPQEAKARVARFVEALALSRPLEEEKSDWL
jgi:hypothetical protein